MSGVRGLELEDQVGREKGEGLIELISGETTKTKDHLKRSMDT